MAGATAVAERTGTAALDPSWSSRHLHIRVQCIHRESWEALIFIQLRLHPLPINQHLLLLKIYFINIVVHYIRYQ